MREGDLRALDVVTVVVPAHDEEERLERCLSSVRDSRAALLGRRPTIRARVVVVLDGCTDGSAAIARSGADEIVTLDARSVGVARAHGVRRAALLAGDVPPARHWIASTDADSVVPRDWLCSQVGAADAGADLVLGPVLLDPRDTPAAAMRAWRAADHGGAGGEPSVYGANLGVRLDAYLRADGFPPLAEHEDVALVRALARTGVRPAAGSAVLTSGRTTGRSPAGFAGFLSDLVAAAPPRGREAGSVSVVPDGVPTPVTVPPPDEGAP